jgi:hypothetical protein
MRLILILLSLCSIMGSATASTNNHTPQNIYTPFAHAGDRICERSPAPGELEWLDLAETYISEHVCRAGVWFDSFFVNERDIEENVDRFIRVFNNLHYKRGDGLEWRVRVNARIQLPGLKERLSVMLSDDLERDLTQRLENTQFKAHTGTTDSGITGNKISELRDTHNLSLRWGMINTAQQSFSVRVRVRLNELLTPSVIGRYRYTHGLGENMLARFTQSIFWEKQEGFGETSRLDLERLLHPEILLRWSNVATLSQNSQGIDWGTSLSLKHSLSAHIALSYDASIEGITSPATYPTQYRLGIRYRQNFLRPWLFFEIEPYHAWIEDLNRQRYQESAIIFRIEAHFGQKKI